MRRTTIFGLMMAFLAVLMPISVLTPSAQATTLSANLPGGRSNYVVTMMGGSNNYEMYSKLAYYIFATNGTVTQKYWYWNDNMISGYSNAGHWKPATGYTTTGCRHACPVRTPLGFQPGSAAPKVITGTWKIDAYGHLYVQWSATRHETYRMNSSQAGFTAITAMTGYSTGAIQRGWGFGSNASLSQGASIAAVYASTQLLGPMSVNVYGVPTTNYDKQSFYFGNYTHCTYGTCLESNENTSSDKTSWYSSYIAGNPAKDGRKNYWNSQKGYVTQVENPGSVCIGYGGGHTSAILQVLNDSGKFVGWVGAEASLDRRAYMQAGMGAWAAVLLPMVPTISTLH